MGQINQEHNAWDVVKMQSWGIMRDGRGWYVIDAETGSVPHELNEMPGKFIYRDIPEKAILAAYEWLNKEAASAS